ncbi:hypothetical protein G7062_02680 [Erysipelothrix sp. HDW6C]|uniref:HdeD family acid-resistance protein n=1 Tax=Erysipelothrix sp. HDW6C TaxID=2714930 RepID=UPI00140A6A86|nr:hypothetical protein [Erysipelothrix sp. HDW6C]QIK69260.1 hypothetical protein G7062_02680 [Erysipelothrix sp. HDW6C]
MDLNKKEKITLYLQLLLSVALVTLGILFIYRDNLMWSLIFWAIIAALIGTALLSIYRSIVNRDIFQALIGLGSVMLAVIFYRFDRLYIEIFAIAFGTWALFNAAVHGLEFFVHVKDNTRGKFTSLFATLISLGMGLLLIFSGVESRFIINLQIGAYIILFGIVQGFSSIRVLFKKEVRVSLSAPVVVAALIPNFLIKNISAIELQNPEVFSEDVRETKGNNLSVYLYAKDEGHERIGHLDIGYKGGIYSYGAHDNFNRAKSMAYGDGVMIVGSEKDFVQYAVNTGTTVFRFVVQLTELQAEMIEERIAVILNDAYFYDYPYQDDPEGENYLSRLRHAGLHVDFYKFHKGKFKTYNVFTTNCVLVADQIVESTGMKLFQISGVATPGAYYEYLDSQINKPGSIVVGKEVYRKAHPIAVIKE